MNRRLPFTPCEDKPLRYETSYLIVAGVAWIRRSSVWTSDGRNEDTTWVVTFGEGAPVVRRGAGRDLSAGELDGLSWELRWSELASPFATPHRLLRPLAPTTMTTQPALAFSGRIGDVSLDGVPGHSAQLAGKRHAQTWGWAHASDAAGRWLHLLTATSPPLPRVSQYATDGRAPGLPLARASVGPNDVTVGPYTASAPPESFVGLRYLDTDGSTIWCYHSEQAVVGDFAGAAMEIAVREPIPGWAVEP